MTDNQLPATDWKKNAARLGRATRPLIGGKQGNASGEHIELINPADGSAGLSYQAGGDAEVDAAVTSSNDAQGGGAWQSMPPGARREALLKLAGLMDANADTLGLHDCMDIGKPIAAASMEAHIAASLCRYYGEIIDKVYSGQTVPTTPGSFELHVRRPRGVVAAIVPWNYPIINVTLKIAPALAAGNAVVIKPSELSPGSALRLAELALEAGLPPGAVNVVPGAAQTGAALARHAGTDLITFTGSTATGKALMQAAGDNALKPLMLECGGKSPELVFADAAGCGVQEMAQAIVGGAFANQGQLCVARTRLLIEQPLHDELVDAIAAELEQVQPGDPLNPATQWGPLASAAQQQRVEGHIAAGADSSATMRLDGRSPPGAPAGCYVGPTLFTDVDPGSALAREEIFGPVLSVFSFAGEEQAVAMANDSQFGLAATVWTRDLARAHRLSAAIKTGKLRITATAEPRMGAGWAHESEPCAQSGFGVEGGRLGLESYTRLQAVQIDF